MSDWIDPAILALFVPTFFFVSVTPGMCMTLAMTLGMSLGVRRTLHMMWGELVGVALVSVLSVIGVAAVMLKPDARIETDELREWVNANVAARFQRIAGLQIHLDFPRNAAGKTLKRELRASHLSHGA